MIYQDESSTTASPVVFGEIRNEHNGFAAGAQEHGATLLGGAALHSTATDSSLRGGSEVTDGCQKCCKRGRVRAKQGPLIRY
jgi:hypothetical protein